MAKNDGYNGIFISRIMPCEKCRQKQSPKKDQMFVTYGGRSQKYKIHIVEHSAKTANHGLTPHFVQCLGLNKAGDGIVIISNCCIDGCDITLTWNEKKGFYEIDFKNVNATVLPINEWDALLLRWHGGTGFEI